MSSGKEDKVIATWASNQEVGKSALEPAPADKWQILYWPARDADGNISAGAGRAEYLRVIFEEAGVQYEEITSNIQDFFWTRLDLQSFPVLAPPAIRKGDFVLCQTPICAKHLAIEFDMYPKNQMDASHAEQIVTTVHEYIAEGRMAFHPVKNTLSYHKQVEEAKPYIEAFQKERMPRYLGNFERYLKANKTESGFFMGETLTYVDLQVMVMLQVTRSQWPEAWESLSDIPSLKAFLATMEARPKINLYLESPRKSPFAGDSLM